MASNEEILGSKKNSGGGIGVGGGGGGAGLARQREAAKERQAEDENKAHERELAKQEPIQERIADGNDVVLSNSRWDREKAYFMQDKVKASVDVAIPASRGEVKKIVFNLYALLPGGKRSDLIASVTGFPDKSGTATAEFTLFLPKNEERLIVKPVESYQYMFTAKHKYSKEISGPKLQVVDHMASTVRFHPENIDINLPGGIGDLRGSISEWSTWETKSSGEVLMGGLSVTVEFRNRSQKLRETYREFKWKQFIESNAPKRGNGEMYEDVLESELNKRPGKEYWYGDGQDRRYQIEMYNVKDGGYFTDRPGRDFSQSETVTWTATLVLFGIDRSAKSHELASLRYGFKLTPDGKVSVVPPSLIRKVR